jgi:hypothetical protein
MVPEQDPGEGRRVPARSRGASRRRRLAGGRRHQVQVRLNDAEYEEVSARAAGAHVSVPRFLAEAGLNAGQRLPCSQEQVRFASRRS